MVGPQAQPPGGRVAVARRATGDPRATQLSTQLRPRRAGHPHRGPVPAREHRVGLRHPAVARPRRPRLGLHRHRGRNLASGEVPRPDPCLAKTLAGERQNPPVRAAHRGTGAPRLDPDRGSGTLARAGTPAAAPRPRRPAVPLRSVAVGPGASAGPVRLRAADRNLQAGEPAPLRVLLPSGARWRAPDRTRGSEGAAGGRQAGRARHPLRENRARPPGTATPLAARSNDSPPRSAFNCEDPLGSGESPPPAVDVTSPGLVHQEPVEASRDCD